MPLPFPLVKSKITIPSKKYNGSWTVLRTVAGVCYCVLALHHYRGGRFQRGVVYTVLCRVCPPGLQSREGDDLLQDDSFAGYYWCHIPRSRGTHPHSEIESEQREENRLTSKAFWMEGWDTGKGRGWTLRMESTCGPIPQGFKFHPEVFGASYRIWTNRLVQSYGTFS